MSPTPLTATYNSPTATQTFSHDLPALPQDDGSVAAKTAYLSAMRSKASKLQGEVNVYLTQKMEEDKATEATKGAGEKVDEQREEEMYGEEDLEGEA